MSVKRQGYQSSQEAEVINLLHLYSAFLVTQSTSGSPETPPVCSSDCESLSPALVQMKVTAGALERNGLAGYGPQMTALSLLFLTGFRVFLTACDTRQNLQSLQVAQVVQLLQIRVCCVSQHSLKSMRRRQELDRAVEGQ